MSTINHDGSAYDLRGQAEAPAIAFIHGLGLNRQIWNEYVARFAQRYRVLAYDLYGHGDSAPPPEEPSLSLFARQLRGLLDEVGIERAALVGFSLGGMINRRFVLDSPARASALAILNSPHERAPEAQRQVEQRALDSQAGGPGANLEATLERWFTAEFRAAHPDYLERVRAWLRANDAGVYAQCRQVLAFGVTELIRPEPPLALPALVMTCEHDSGSTPDMSRAIAAEIDGAQVVVAPHLRHMGLVENPSFFVGALDEFFESHLFDQGRNRG